MTTVLHWNGVLLELSRRDHSQGYAGGQHTGPTRTSRAMAIAHLAIYNAVAAVRRHGSLYRGLSGTLGTEQFPSDTHLGEIIDGAASAALTALYPRQRALIDDSIASNRSSAVFDAGVAIGQAMVADRDPALDLSNVADGRPEADEHRYGAHQADPYDAGQPLLGPRWGEVRRFAGPRVALAPFPGQGLGDYLADAHYKADYVEVRDHGARAPGKRSAEQTLIGLYWGYDGATGLGVPPRLYNQIAREAIASKGLTDPLALAELFAKVNVAMADAGIDAWHYKYVHNLWRPVVGIRNESHQHVDALPDCFWAPLGAPQTNKVGTGPRTPPFPAYPSGHATFGAALFQVLRLSFGGAAIATEDVLAAEDQAAGGDPPFTFISDELNGISVDADGSTRTRHARSFTSYARAVFENAVSRVYLGVHWRFDGLPKKTAATQAELNVGGVPLGLGVGRQTHDFFEQLKAAAGTPYKRT